MCSSRKYGNRLFSPLLYRRTEKSRRYRLLIVLSVLACTSTERRFWTLTRSQWFEIVETAFTEKEWYDNFRCPSTLSREIFLATFAASPASRAMLSEPRVDLHMLSQIGADQRREGSSEKSWFGTINCLHCTPYPSWARFSGSRTNFIRARTTSRHGPSTGESLVQHGWGKEVYTTKSIRAEPIFLVRVFFSSEPCQNLSAV